MASGGQQQPQQQPQAPVDLLPLDALRRFLQRTSAPLFGDGDAARADAFARDLASPAATAALEQFIVDAGARLLQVTYFPPDAARMDVDSDGDGRPFLRVNLGVEYAATGKARGHDAVCFIKRLSAPLTGDVGLNHQLQVMTLALGKTRGGEGPHHEPAAASSGENTEEEEEDDHSSVLSAVYNYVHQSFGPLVTEYSKVHQPQHEVATSMSDGAR
ncbi:hypothetical protein PybrP1_012892, partial [[Pythium] brassicae (nom. inval.)]